MSKNSANTSISDNKLFIPSVIAVGAFIAYKLFSSDESGGTSDTDPDTEPDKKNLSYPPGSYTLFADTIEAAIYGTYGIVTLWEDDEAVADVLMQMNTLDDVYMLIEKYGRRYVGIFISDGGNLIQTIQEYLDNDLIEDVNANYQAKNIPFQF